MYFEFMKKRETASKEGRKKMAEINLSDSIKSINVVIEEGQITQITQRKLKRGKTQSHFRIPLIKRKS